MSESTELMLRRPSQEIDSLLRVEQKVKDALDAGVKRSMRWESLSFLNIGRKLQFFVVAKSVGLLTTFSEIELCESADNSDTELEQDIEASKLNQLQNISGSLEEGRRLAFVKTEGWVWDYLPGRIRNAAMYSIAGKHVLNAYGIKPSNSQGMRQNDVGEAEAA